MKGPEYEMETTARPQQSKIFTESRRIAYLDKDIKKDLIVKQTVILRQAYNS